MQDLSTDAVVGSDFSDLVAHSRYRRHPRFSFDMLVAQQKGAVADCLARQGFACVLGPAERPIGLIAYKFLEWDTAHFGLPMGRLLVGRAPGTDAAAWRLSLAEVVERIRMLGCQHLSIDVDIDDYTTLHSLCALGFEILDIKRTFVTHVCKRVPAYERFSGDIRLGQPGDHTAILDILQDVNFASRFTRDPLLDAARARQMYEMWLRNHLQNLSSGRALAIVLARRGRVEACGLLGETDFRNCGFDYRVRSGSLYVSRRESTGAYGPVIYHMTRKALKSHDAVEATVSLNNSAAMRVVENIRPNQSTMVYSLRAFLE